MVRVVMTVLAAVGLALVALPRPPYADVAREHAIKATMLRTRVHYAALRRLRTGLCAAELAS